jgi:hypothetical protein
MKIDNTEVAKMGSSSDSLEALKLISDWAKWLVTIETAAIAIIGTLFTSERIVVPYLAKLCGTVSIIFFLISIAGAAILLLTLPEIAQNYQSGTNIWLTQDSVAGRLMGMNTQSFALIESIFFGLGLITVVIMIIIVIWK